MYKNPKWGGFIVYSCLIASIILVSLSIITDIFLF